MMINGWRRFRWSNLLTTHFPAAVYKDPGFITLEGHLKIKDTRKPFADKPFILFINCPDSNRIIRLSSTDNRGYFRIDSLLFFEGARIFIKDIRGKKSDLLEVKLTKDSLARVFNLPDWKVKPFPVNYFRMEAGIKKWLIVMMPFKKEKDYY